MGGCTHLWTLQSMQAQSSMPSVRAIYVIQRNRPLSCISSVFEIDWHKGSFAHYWLDTRTMVADGLTKGGIDRRLLHELAEKCFYRCDHEAKRFTAIKGKLDAVELSLGEIGPPPAPSQPIQRRKVQHQAPLSTHMFVESLMGLQCRCLSC